MFFFQAEDGIRDVAVTGVQTCALPILFAHLRELDALPPEHGPVFAREEGADQGSGAQLDALDLPEHFWGDQSPAGAERGGLGTSTILAFVRHGTPTASRIFPMTRSESMSSASASNVSRTRCRSTSKAMALTSSGTTKARPRRNACARAACARQIDARGLAPKAMSGFSSGRPIAC